MTKITSNVRTARRTHRRSLHLTAEQKYYIIQKLIGAIVTLAGIIGGFAVQSFPVLLVGVLIGLAFMFSKDKILMVSNVYWDENPKKKHENSINKHTEYACKNKQNMI